MALRDWRQLHRRGGSIRRIHRLVLMREAGLSGISTEPPPEHELGGGELDDPTRPFSAETTRRLQSALVRVANRTDSNDAVSALLRTVAQECREATPDRMIVSVHRIWRQVCRLRGDCTEEAVNRYRAVVAELLALHFGEDLVGLP